MSDRIAEIRQASKGLLEQESAERERVQIRIDVGSVLPIYIGRSFPVGSFNAIIRSIDASDLPTNFKRPKIQGLSVYWSSVTSNAGGSFDMVMELLQVEAIDVFIVFIARLCEIVERCENSREALGKALGQIELWKHFFSSIGSKALSESRQTGLFGELTMLLTLIKAGLNVSAAVKAWTGASATNQDFEFNQVAVEVKSTTSIDTMEVSISNIRQLDTTGLDHLYLARFAFDVRQGDSKTLVELVSELRNSVSSYASHLRAVFEQKLISAGYLDKYTDEYSARSYSLRGCNYYRVKGNFPRLEEKELPKGVRRVKYSVNLQGCSEFKEDSQTVMCKVMSEHDRKN